MSEQTPYNPEENHDQEPIPVGEIIADYDAVADAQPDLERKRGTLMRDLEAERADVEHQISELWEEIHSGRLDGETGLAKIDSLKREMLSIDADKFETRNQENR